MTVRDKWTTEASQAHTIDPDMCELICKKFNVLGIITFNFFDYDFNYNRLRSWFSSRKKEKFESNDRFIIVHFDTDYYINNSYGVELNNFFTICEELDIPPSTLFFYTNYFGISNEINEILKDYHESDRPTIFETIVNESNYPPNGYNNLNINYQNIKYHALCMMNGSKRSHRYATYNELKELVPDKIILTLGGAGDINTP
jgi:hypothetical protein